MKKITIIGAGIGGLTLAIALQKKGIDFEVYESFSEFKDLGAGIMLANNAMQVFSALGIDNEIKKEGFPYKALNITTQNLSVLSTIATDEFSNIKVQSFAIHRSKLQQVLLNQLPASKIILGKKLTKLTKQDQDYQLVFNDNSTVTATTVIGADGIHSIVRDEISIKVEKRNADQQCWRGIVDFILPSQYDYQLFEMWGEGLRFGFVQIAPGKVYWYALKNSKSNLKTSKVKLLELFKTFNPLVNQIIAKTEENVILNNKIIDIKPIKNWYVDQVCLIGDAAHATTPNMGQGACQSIEDALCLAEKLSEHKEVEVAFKAFQDYRMYKANKVITTSWMIGKISHWKNPLVTGLRNFMVKSTPKSTMRKQNEFLYKV